MATVSDHKTLDCPLCFKTLTNHRVLPCFHTFCEKCLGDYIESQVQGGSKFACPLCAAETFPFDSDLAIEKWASTLPLSSLLCSVMESTLNLDDGNVECEPCKTDGENITAEFWCTICQEKLCRSCNGLHKRNKLLRNHIIVSIDDMEQHKQSNVNFNQECGRHRDKVKLICIDHRELCCAVCVATNHRQCNDVRSIDDIIRDQSQRSTSDYPSIIRDIRKIKTEMEKIMTEKKNNAKQLLQEKDQIFHDINIRIDTIINHLNKLRNAFRQETDQLYKDTESSILEKERALRSFITDVNNSEEILEVFETRGTPQQKFTVFEIIRGQISSHHDQLNSKLTENVEVHFSMKSNKPLDEIEGSLNSLDSIDVISKYSAKACDALQDASKIMKNLNARTKISTEMRAAQVQKAEDLMRSPVAFIKGMTRDELGSGTLFTGGAYLVNGRLVMSDYKNNRLVELDNEYNIVQMYLIDGIPTDVAAGNKDNEIYVAVVAAGERYIYKCALHNHLTVISRIKTPSGTWGIAVSGDNIVVCTPDVVVILAQDGSTVRSIPKSGGGSYVAVSQTQRTVYHRDDHDIVCRTWEGHEVFRYRHQQLKYPCGIVTDKYSNVYTCGNYSHNVHQVSSDGQSGRIVQLHNISKPYSVILHPKKNHLIVTSWGEDTVCEIYQFVL